MSGPWVKPVRSTPYDDMDIDDLLAQLTPEEIEQLQNEVDPDDSLLPPSERCKYKTDKTPTGPYNREALLGWLEKKAKEEKDWEHNKTFVKETRGKVWVSKQQDDSSQKDARGAKVFTEFDDVLSQATEEELVDLAAALGFHSMLNQEQYNSSVENKPVVGGFKGVARSEKLQPVADLPPNTTDVMQALQQLKSNDPKLKELNLNNMRSIPQDIFIGLLDALKTNTQLETLSAANTGITDKLAQKLAEMLEVNAGLKRLHLDSNFISSQSIVTILQAVNKQQHLLELTLENQKPSVLGVRNEMAITRLIEENSKIEKLGLVFDTAHAKARVLEKLQANYDKHRKSRAEK